MAKGSARAQANDWAFHGGKKSAALFYQSRLHLIQCHMYVHTCWNLKIQMNLTIKLIRMAPRIWIVSAFCHIHTHTHGREAVVIDAHSRFAGSLCNCRDTYALLRAQSHILVTIIHSVQAQCRNSDAYILTGNVKSAHALGMKASKQ